MDIKLTNNSDFSIAILIGNLDGGKPISVFMEPRTEQFVDLDDNNRKRFMELAHTLIEKKLLTIS